MFAMLRGCLARRVGFLLELVITFVGRFFVRKGLGFVVVDSLFFDCSWCSEVRSVNITGIDSRGLLMFCFDSLLRHRLRRRFLVDRFFLSLGRSRGRTGGEAVIVSPKFRIPVGGGGWG